VAPYKGGSGLAQDTFTYSMGKILVSEASENLFLPFASEKLRLPNRMVMAPMTRYLSPGHVIPVEAANYYSRRIKGGVSMVITEATIVDEPHATGYDDVPAMVGTEQEAGWRAVVDAVHQAGGKIFSQLWHCGAVRKPGVGPQPDLPGISPTRRLRPDVHTGREMDRADIDRVVEAFARSARTAIDLGFDGIEIHGAHGYLIDQFLWQGSNQRTDEYGGSLAKRSRFPMEVVSAIREVVGPNVPICFRFSQWKQQDYSARLAKTPQELEQILMPLMEAGVDIFHASTRRFWASEFPGSDLNLAGWAKKITGKPAITCGSICLDTDFAPDNSGYEEAMQNFGETSAMTQEALLDEVGKMLSPSAGLAGLHGLNDRFEAGEFDLVAVGRALISNPSLPSLIREERWSELEPYDASLLASLD
jgi:2,4-dienoyl-CoA reductase-like NADH-dependent reductase (Old Yellow Enzyme family)